MPTVTERKDFEAAVQAGVPPAALAAAVVGAKTGAPGGARTLVAALGHGGFVAPEAIPAIYEAFAAAWLGGPDGAPPLPDRPLAETPSADFWNAFWAIVADAEAGLLDAGSITARVAALGGLLPASLCERAEAIARAHPKAARPHQRPAPPRLTMAELARQPDGSLGAAFHQLIDENKFDLEVLDRDAIGLAVLPPAMRYLNTRILQMHDVWHLVAGYRTTALHEIGISAFQLAQFGHNYSAMLLATVAAAIAFGSPQAAPLVFGTIAEAWRHGTATPSFMAIDWEGEWHRPVDAIRARHAIAPFAGSFPPDLFEQMRAAS